VSVGDQWGLDGRMRADLDIVTSVLDHRLRQDDLEHLLRSLPEASRDELIVKIKDMLGRMPALIEINNAVAGALSLWALLPRLTGIISSALTVEDAHFLLHDTRNDLLYTPRSKGEEDLMVPVDKGLTGVVFQSGEPLTLQDVRQDNRFDPTVDQEAGRTCSNWMCAPLISAKGYNIGVCRVANKTSGAFTPDDLTLLEALANQAAPLVENTLFFEQFKKSRREDARMMEITNALSSDLQLDTLLKKIVGVVTEILDADRGTIFLYDAKTDTLFSRIAAGLGSTEIRIPKNAGIAGEAFTTGNTINIPDAYADPRFNKEIDKKTGYRTKTILCMPIINKKGERIGVAQVLNKSDGPFNEEDEIRLAGFSTQVSIALENANLFESVLNMKNFNDSILKSLSTGVITLDEERRISKVNEAAERMFNINEDDIIERPIAEVFRDGNLWISDSIDKVADTGEADLAFDTEIAIAGHDPVTVNSTALPLIDTNGNNIGYMVIFEDITSEKRLKSTMSRYMTKEVLDRMLEGGDSVLGGAAQEVTILFSDVRNFTTIAETIGAKETVNLLNEYFTDMVELIMDNKGMLDKYIGDAIMAIFGAPFTTADDCDNAVSVANKMMTALWAYNDRRQAKSQNPIDIGIGLSTGEVVAGNIGSPKRMDYTVIGDPVNLAARLESATKQYGVKILLSEFTVNKLKEPFKLRELDLIRVKGKNRPVSVYDALDFHTPESFPDMDQAVRIFADALADFRARNWDSAADGFASVLALNPQDRPSQLYGDRCRYYKQTPPPEDWDGVWVLESK